MSQTDELKQLMSNAKTLIDELPGGEMLERDQDQVIQALETLKKQKLYDIFQPLCLIHGIDEK
jgi:hypothetical protein